jgi:hypothetical protein
VYGRLHVRSADGLLDPLADLLGPAIGPMLSTLVPVLKGLPLVGGLVNVVGSIAASVGGQKIGSLLTGQPITSAAFVTNPNDAPTPAEQLAFQIDASTDTGSPLFLAQLPFSLPTSGCHSPNSTTPSQTPGPVPVSIVLPIVSNSSLQVMCATYNSTPSSPSMLIAQPCWNSTGPDGSMAEEPANLSQIFAWNQDTGVVQPLWNGTASTRTGMSCPPSSGVLPTPSSTVAAGNGNGSPAPQTVTLVFSADPTIGNSTTGNNNGTSTVLLNENGGNSTSPSNSTIPNTEANDDGSYDSGMETQVTSER